MAFTNFDTKEINCKILVFGPKGSGKTTSLRSVYNQTSDEVKSGMMELIESEESSSSMFDFLPLGLGQVKDFYLKMHLFGINMSSIFDSVNSTLIKGVDGLIFVADSSVESMITNIETLEAMKKMLHEEGGNNYFDLPKIIQYNKRDVPGAVPIAVLRKELNPNGDPDFETIATESKGTFSVVDAISKKIIKELMP